MTRDTVRSVPSITLLLSICAIVLSCGRSIPAETLNVSLSNTDTFEYATAAGDEDGARITTQPRHADVSRIRRDAETDWVATYIYRPATGYIGPDVVELEILTGSDGVSPPDVRRVTIQFSVREPR